MDARSADKISQNIGHLLDNMESLHRDSIWSLTLDQIRTYAAFYETGSFRGASNRLIQLGVVEKDQSSVSKQIRNVDQKIQHIISHTSSVGSIKSSILYDNPTERGGRVSFTEFGHIFGRFCKDILQLLNLLKREVERSSGELCLATHEMYIPLFNEWVSYIQQEFSNERIGVFCKPILYTSDKFPDILFENFSIDFCMCPLTKSRIKYEGSIEPGVPISVDVQTRFGTTESCRGIVIRELALEGIGLSACSEASREILRLIDEMGGKVNSEVLRLLHSKGFALVIPKRGIMQELALELFQREGLVTKVREGGEDYEERMPHRIPFPQFFTDAYVHVVVDTVITEWLQPLEYRGKMFMLYVRGVDERILRRLKEQGRSNQIEFRQFEDPLPYFAVALQRETDAERYPAEHPISRAWRLFSVLALSLNKKGPENAASVDQSKQEAIQPTGCKLFESVAS